MGYKYKEHNLILEFLLVSISSIFFWYLTGLSDGSGFGTDMQRYYSAFINLNGFFEIISYHSKDPINYLLIYFLKLFGFTFYFLILLVIFLSYKAASYRLNILFGKRVLILQIFTLLFYSFFLTLMVYVAIRQGMAIIVVLYFCIKTVNEEIGSKKFYKELLFIVFSSLLHLSTLIIVPFIFFKKIFKRYIRLFNLLFYLVFIAYSTGLYYEFAFFDNSILGDFSNIFRSLSVTEEHTMYEVGPTLKKSLSIILPILIVEITKKYYTNYQRIKLEPIILFYKYISIVTMLLSNLPYNDRILIFGWAFIPIMLSLPLNLLIKYIFSPINFKLKSKF